MALLGPTLSSSRPAEFGEPQAGLPSAPSLEPAGAGSWRGPHFWPRLSPCFSDSSPEGQTCSQEQPLVWSLVPLPCLCGTPLPLTPPTTVLHLQTRHPFPSPALPGPLSVLGPAPDPCSPQLPSPAPGLLGGGPLTTRPAQCWVQRPLMDSVGAGL